MRRISRRSSGALLLGIVAACGCSMAYLPGTENMKRAAIVDGAPCGVAERLPAAVSPDSMDGGIGVRVGYLLPVSEDQDDYEGAVAVGVCYAGVMKRLPYEIGVDFAQVNTEAGIDEATIYSLRCDVFFSRWNAYSGPNTYLLGGFGVDFASPDAGDSEFAGILKLGGGLAMAQNRFDIRATYGITIGSDNIGGLVGVSVGHQF